MCFLGYLGGADPDGVGPRVKFEKMRKLFKFEIISLEHCIKTENPAFDRLRLPLSSFLRIRMESGVRSP